MPNSKYYLSYPYRTQSNLSPFTSGEELGREIHDRLRAKQLDIFFDKDVKPGERWDVVAHARLKNCKYVLVLLAPDTLFTSQGVQNEMRQSLHTNKMIIPLFVGGFSIKSHIPPEFKEIGNNRGMFLDTAALDTGLSQLVQNLRDEKDSNSSFLRRITPLRWTVLTTILGLLFAFLALYPEQSRTEWFRNLGLISSTSTSVPTPILSPTTQAVITSSHTPSLINEPTFTPLLTNISSPDYTPTETATATQTLTETPTPVLTFPGVIVTPIASMTIRSAGLTYPCDASIVNNGNGQLNIVRGGPSGSSSYRSLIQQGALIKIISKEQEMRDVFWYHIADTQGNELGWIPIKYAEISENCPK